MQKSSIYWLSVSILFVFLSCSSNTTEQEKNAPKPTAQEKLKSSNTLDTADYERRMAYISNGDTTGTWPVKTPYPLPGAIFPYNRVIAYYGNLYSKKMGILGELPKDEMLAKLKGEIKQWEAADSTIPVKAALHYVAVTAQTNGGKQRMRMPSHQIDSIVNWAKEIDALVFLDIQVGWSTLEEEIPALEKYLKMPQVHLGIDPEFSMKFGDLPGTRIGTFDATDINYAIRYLDTLTRNNNLPPKVLVVHRFTQGMVTNAAQIKPMATVQVVIDMDGWGDRILKRSTWLRYIQKDPVQFGGFKIFYKNDLKKGAGILYTPAELMKFTPHPIYIQYQ